MAGDEVSATTQYYYKNAVTNITGNNLTTSIVTALIQSIAGSPATTGLDKSNTTPISTQLNADASFLSYNECLKLDSNEGKAQQEKREVIELLKKPK